MALALAERMLAVSNALLKCVLQAVRQGPFGLLALLKLGFEPIELVI